MTASYHYYYGSFQGTHLTTTATVLFKVILLPIIVLSFSRHSTYHYYYCLFRLFSYYYYNYYCPFQDTPLTNSTTFLFRLLLLPVVLLLFPGHSFSHYYHCPFQGTLLSTTTTVSFRKLFLPLLLHFS